MAEPDNGGAKSSPPDEKKDLSMEKRLVLAFVLMGAVLFTTPYIFKSEAPPPMKQTITPNAKRTTSSPPPAAATFTSPAPEKAAAVPAASPAIPVESATQEDLFTIDTSLCRVVFSNKGAVVRSWKLKNYTTAGKPLELVNTASTVDFPFALWFKTPLAVNPNTVLFKAAPEPNGLGIVYSFSDGRMAVRKKFLFARSSYQTLVSTEVTLDGKPIPHLIAWRGGFGDAAVANPAVETWSLRYDSSDTKLFQEPVKTAQNGTVKTAGTTVAWVSGDTFSSSMVNGPIYINGAAYQVSAYENKNTITIATSAGNQDSAGYVRPVLHEGTFSFAGIDDKYFTAAFLPQGSSRFDSMTFSDTVPTTVNSTPASYVGTAVGGAAANQFDLFVGPKDTDVLRSVNPKLEQLIDYGWFWFLAKPLFAALHLTADHFIHNYGWAIIVVTVVINFVLFPLKVSSMKSMKKMQALQPQVQVINDKYKGISVRDPRAADKNTELMDLYKANGVNPAGGCLPMALQIPFFIAFYKVLSVSIEMRGAHWLWVSDLSTYEHLPIHLLPLVMIVTQFISQKMTPTSAAVDPNQQKMMMFMPLIFGFMFYNLPAGVVLYYLTSNLVGIAQQMFFNRTITVSDLPQPPAPGKKRSGKK